LASPKFVLVNTLSELPAALDKIGFPAICKPIDAAGSVHVRKVNNRGEAEAAARRILEGQDLLWGHKLANSLLLEEYIPGKEYSAEGVIQNGQLFHYSITEKFVADQNEFIEIGHIVNPPLDAELKLKIETYLQQVLAAFQADHCPFHAEFRINKDGQPVLMEVAARLAGDRIGDLVSLARDVNYMDAVLATYLGEKLSPPTLGDHCAGIRFFYRPQLAAYSAIEGLEEAKKLPAEELTFYYKTGQPIPDLPKPLRRLGHVILKSDDYPTLLKNLRSIDETLVFKP
jgi:biotin carboxylase